MAAPSRTLQPPTSDMIPAVVGQTTGDGMADLSIDTAEKALERQAERASDEAARQALKAVQQRVAAVSVAHRHVGWVDDAEQVELSALVREIVGDLAGSAG